MTAKEIISDALFDCYGGYNAETISMFKMQSQYQRDAQAERAVKALEAAGYRIVKFTVKVRPPFIVDDEH